MDKRKLIAQTATKSKYPKWEVTKITNILLENIFEALRQGEEICINGFGKFEPTFEDEAITQKQLLIIKPKNKQGNQKFHSYFIGIE